VWVGSGEKRGQRGLSKGTKNEAVDSEHASSKDRGLQLCTKSHHSKKEGYLLYSTFIDTTNEIIIL
jgi:hypothetical protein